MELAAQPNVLETVKNLLLAYTVYKYGKYLLAYLRVKGVRGSIVALFKGILQKSITLARRFVPGANAAIAAQVEKNVSSLQKKLVGDTPEHLKQRALPAKGLPAAAVVTELKRLKALEHVDWKAGKVSGAIYHGGDDVNKLVTDAFGMFTIANPLHPELFPGVRQMEAEIVSMVLRMYNAPDSGCGNVTSGGTESLLMAVKTYRDMARKLRGVTEPEMIAPFTIHTAIDKAALYFGVKLVHIAVDPVTGQVDIPKVARAINANTIMLAGSAPNFPHGIVDPIPELAALAKKHKLPMHVDACLGGFIVPFAEKAGFPLPYHIDFRVDGVTSISVDTHKYGFAPKGSSVIMYKSKEIRNYQYCIATEWPGGVYCSPSVSGSRPGALIAGCWAAMMHFGESGYVETTRQIITATRTIIDGIKHIEHLRVIGTPLLSVMAFDSINPNVKIYGVADILDKRGWHLNVLQNPPAIHIACTFLTVKSAKQLVTDVKEAVEMLLKDPSSGNGDVAAIYGTMASVPDRSVISDVCVGFLDALTMM
ncbi:pyridoxal phosphate-dependent transferase [Chytriomyces sp. MP71]|nr:pyridoxal phosphate-dependent transferase [Chytriomyces sp. MP71]